MTNREKLAQMSNQELAEELCNVNLDCVGCLGYEWCVTDDGHANGLIKFQIALQVGWLALGIGYAFRKE